MALRFITKDIHAFLDYPVAIVLMTAPFVLELGTSNPLAKWLSIVVGVAALILTIFTNHKLGIIRLLSYRFHVLVDALVGVSFLAAPFILNFSGLDAFYYWGLGAAVAVVISLSSPESISAKQEA